MIYLDNAATTRPDLSAVKAAAQFNESLYYNPSALYREGLSVRKELNAAREFICRSLSSKHDLVFTSCGSEADNQAIFARQSAERRLRRRANTPPCIRALPN